MHIKLYVVGVGIGYCQFKGQICERDRLPDPVSRLSNNTRSTFRVRIHLMDTIVVRTSIGLKNDTVNAMGPICKSKAVRVGVMCTAVTSVWLAKESCPKIECVTPSIRSRAVRPPN
jgi:hypothetical protein